MVGRLNVRLRTLRRGMWSISRAVPIIYRGVQSPCSVCAAHEGLATRPTLAKTDQTPNFHIDESVLRSSKRSIVPRGKVDLTENNDAHLGYQTVG